MRLGAVFPQTEIGNNPDDVRNWAQAVEEMGYSHLLAYDHVLGASTASRPDWAGPYTSATPFHEIFVLFGFFAAVTQRLRLVTGVLILPQRQTALVAKQAAEIDVLSGGRLRLGVGVGWNAVEYEALNEDFATRGARSEEQIAVLRALWSQSAISFTGRWHSIPDAGINPLPVQRPIPIWIGGEADATFRRIARLGDGWFPQRRPDEKARAQMEQLRGYVQEAGRDMREIGVEARLSIGQIPESDWLTYAKNWQALGATHLTVNTMNAAFTTLTDHIDALRKARRVLGELAGE